MSLRPGASRPGSLLAAVLVVAPALAVAQGLSRAEVDARFDALVRLKWNAQLDEVVKVANQPSVTDWRRRATPEQRAAAYGGIVDMLKQDQELFALFDAAYVQSLIDERADSRMAASANAGATNPATAGLTERSGATSLAALATDVSSVARADKSAISISLSALALVSAKDPDVYSSMAAYQSHGLARRFSGTVIFGARIPEKEITGLSSLPSFDTLLDAFAWDVKVRVVGDKDIRSARWTNETVRRGGMLVQLAAVLPSIALDLGPGQAGPEDLKRLNEEAGILLPLLQTLTGETVRTIVARAARSPQLSVKVAGTHLTQEEGKNKYSATALLDLGVGPADFTANVQYSITDDVRLGADRVFQIKLWTLSGSLTSHLAPDAMVKGRTMDWSMGVSASMFQDAQRLPVAASNTWKAFTSLEFPVAGGGKLPVSVIFSNDPNALTKEKYVSGQVGLSYDFSALKELFKK